MNFQTIETLRATCPRMTKGELSERYYPNDAYCVDCAIPQCWLDDAHARGMDKYVGESGLAFHFVTVYPRDGSPNFIGPLTVEGVEILARLATVK